MNFNYDYNVNFNCWYIERYNYFSVRSCFRHRPDSSQAQRHHQRDVTSGFGGIYCTSSSRCRQPCRRQDRVICLFPTCGLQLLPALRCVFSLFLPRLVLLPRLLSAFSLLRPRRILRILFSSIHTHLLLPLCLPLLPKEEVRKQVQKPPTAAPV
jgi:hypothetical protein